MSILIILLMLVVSVASFFALAIKYGRGRPSPPEVLDLDNFPLAREKEVLLNEHPEDLII